MYVLLYQGFQSRQQIIISKKGKNNTENAGITVTPQIRVNKNILPFCSKCHSSSKRIIKLAEV